MDQFLQNIKEIEFVISKLQITVQAQMVQEETLSNSFSLASVTLIPRRDSMKKESTDPYAS